MDDYFELDMPMVRASFFCACIFILEDLFFMGEATILACE